LIQGDALFSLLFNFALGTPLGVFRWTRMAWNCKVHISWWFTLMLMMVILWAGANIL